jgi:hypothetical protein
MQSLFALKDTIGKKETREISLLCGVTITQVCCSPGMQYCYVLRCIYSFLVWPHVRLFHVLFEMDIRLGSSLQVDDHECENLLTCLEKKR